MLSQAERKLQQQWYDKLRRSGFSDLERTDKFSDTGVSRAAIRQPSDELGKKYSPTTEYFYDLARMWLEHTQLRTRDHYLWSLYCEGVTYRQICKRMRRRFAYRKDRGKRWRFTLHWVCLRLKLLRSDMFNWHYHDPAGLLNPNQESVQIGEDWAALMHDNKPANGL